MTSLVQIKQGRIQADLDAIGKIGKNADGSYSRIGFTAEESAAIDYVKGSMEKAGFKTKFDDTGNLFCIFEGKSGKSVLVGSHLDTVTNGGNFDGVAGVAAGMEALRCLKEGNAMLKHGVGLVVFRNEESSRFKRSVVGSSIALGIISEKELQGIADNKGVSLKEAINRLGFPALRLKSIEENNAVCYFELHIEQGRVLQDEGKTLGVVTAIAAPVRFRVSVKGRADHSGATPMNLRKDAVAAAAEIILAVEGECKKAFDKGQSIVGTVGVVETPGGTINKVNGETVLFLDLRGIDLDERNQVEKNIMKRIKEIDEKRGTKTDCVETERKKPVPLQKNAIELLGKLCEKEKIPFKVMPSGAGHDAMTFAEKGIETGMLFVPCKEGISHSVEESAKTGDIAVGAKVLLEAVKKKAD